MTLWKKLTVQMSATYRAWARHSYVVGCPVNDTWHPVVKAECAQMNAEYAEKIAAIYIDEQISTDRLEGNSAGE